MHLNIFILSITYYLFNTSTSESINSLIPSLVNDDISKILSSKSFHWVDISCLRSDLVLHIR